MTGNSRTVQGKAGALGSVGGSELLVLMCMQVAWIVFCAHWAVVHIEELKRHPFVGLFAYWGGAEMILSHVWSWFRRSLSRVRNTELTPPRTRQ
jgi:hypothetical protein